MFDRREFLKKSSQLAFAGCLLQKADPIGKILSAEPRKKLKVLILGGTSFLGPHVVESLRRRGHEITLFNRGRTNTHLFPDLEKLKGDRNVDLSALENRKWDAVIDNCGYLPGQLKKSTEMLKNSGYYMFISSVSAYADFPAKDVTEISPTAKTDKPDAKRVTNSNYGALKALCEEEAQKVFPKKSAMVRPGLIVGPGDPTDRFTFWPAQVAKGGFILAPGKPEWTIQFIDVRDLADWMVHLCENQTTGILNAVGPKKPLAMGDFLETCRKVSEKESQFLWMDRKFMREHKTNGREFPFYYDPPKDLGRATIISNKLAIASGLKFRAVEATIKDTLSFHRARGEKYQLRYGMSPERYQKLVKLLRERQKQESESK